jgi:hypothetical protein
MLALTEIGTEADEVVGAIHSIQDGRCNAISGVVASVRRARVICSVRSAVRSNAGQIAGVGTGDAPSLLREEDSFADTVDASVLVAWFSYCWIACFSLVVRLFDTHACQATLLQTEAGRHSTGRAVRERRSRAETVLTGIGGAYVGLRKAYFSFARRNSSAYRVVADSDPAVVMRRRRQRTLRAWSAVVNAERQAFACHAVISGARVRIWPGAWLGGVMGQADADSGSALRVIAFSEADVLGLEIGGAVRTIGERLRHTISKPIASVDGAEVCITGRAIRSRSGVVAIAALVRRAARNALV